MSRFFGHSSWASLACALLLSATVDAQKPGTLEVDLIFPRNDNYAPSNMLPVIFAVQNPSLAPPLELAIFWSINSGSSPDYSVSSENCNGFLKMEAPLNTSLTGDPWFTTAYTPSIAGLEGVWTLSWSVLAQECSSGINSQDNYIVFTTSKDGAVLDIGAATSADTCNATQAFAYNVTSVDLSEVTENHDGCAEYENSNTTDPCAVTISPSAASSISSVAASSTTWDPYAYGPVKTPHFELQYCAPPAHTESSSPETKMSEAAQPHQGMGVLLCAGMFVLIGVALM